MVILNLPNDMKVKRALAHFIFLILLLAFSVPGNAQDLFKGKFEADSYFTTFEGNWKISKVDNKIYVALQDNFKAKKAPDLKIFLSKLSLGDINGNNAAKKEFSLLVAKLTQYKGASTYEIKGNPDFSQYKSIIIHCEEYSKLWGGANLK